MSYLESKIQCMDIMDPWDYTTTHPLKHDIRLRVTIMLKSPVSRGVPAETGRTPKAVAVDM